jgi:hypothetical protein
MQAQWEDAKILDNVLLMIKSLDQVAQTYTKSKSKASFITRMYMSAPHTPGLILPFRQLREMVNKDRKEGEEDDE